ncbi:MAG: hypothetical protein JWQ87_351 [Candidatus Sulfotelmatobacter sp.]|nr:hypothetical protein [Candidatus Sulfotelmatobacter sp.]
MAGGEPRQGDGESVFGQAEGDVGERLGGWSDCRADSGFAGMGGEGDGGSEKRGEELLGGSELRGGSVSQQRGDGNAHEGVESAPKEIEGGDFIGEEFDGEERCAGSDYRPSFEELESGWEREVSEAG